MTSATAKTTNTWLDNEYMPRIKVSVAKHPFASNVVLSLIMGSLVFVVHPTVAVLRTPYWLDEAWVALSTRLPLSQLPQVTASTPLGFSYLLRLLPDHNSLRLLTLVFLALTITTAHWLGFMLGGWKEKQSVGLGLALSGFLLFAPFLVAQNELKQYTADAFMAVLVLLLCARLDERFNLWRLAPLLVAIPVGMFISHTTVFVGVAALAAAWINLAVKKDIRNVLLVSLLSLASLAVSFLYYFLVDRRGQNPRLQDYWSSYYPKLFHLPGFIFDKLTRIEPWHNLLMVTIILILIALGIKFLIASKHRITGTAVLMIFVLAMVTGVAKVYPLLDSRTSTYLMTVGMVAVFMGLVGLGGELAKRLPINRQVPLVIGLAVLLANAWPLVGKVGLPVEDVRAATAYVAQAYRPGDSIVISPGAVYGFAFYWPGAPLVTRNTGAAIGFSPYSRNPRITMVANVSEGEMNSAIVHQFNDLGNGRSEWIIASHLHTMDANAIDYWAQKGVIVYRQGGAKVVRIQK